MVLSSQHHIDSLISNKCVQNVGNANKFLNDNLWSTNTGIQTNNSNANCVFNHQICDEISRSRLDNENMNTNQISSELNLAQNNLRPESNLNEAMQTSKTSYKKLRSHVHDPKINTVITSSTLKYACMALMSMIAICAYVSFIAIGTLGLEYCGKYKKIPTYLLAFGIVGIVQIFLYFSCPFSYSKSIVAKMYEHLIWRLVLNRFSASLFLSDHASTSLYENSGKSYSELSTCEKFNVKISCCSTFVSSFFCCDFCCFNPCKRIIRKATRDANSTIQHQPSMYQFSETNSILSRNLAQSNSGSIARFNASLNSISNRSENIRGNIFEKSKNSESKCSSSSLASKTKRGRRSAPNSIGFKRSRSSSDINPEKKKRSRAQKRRKSLSDHSLGNHYFNGQYGNKYSTHKHLYRHHKKTQQPIKLVDCNTMRFCVFFWIRQILLLFLLIWFICGNYWVFDSELRQDANKTNSSNKNQQEIFKVDFKGFDISRSLNELNSHNLNPIVLKIVCFNFAFYQVIVIYCIFVLFAIVIVFYRIFHKTK